MLAGYGVVVTSMASVLFHVPMAKMFGLDRRVTMRLAMLSAAILAAGVVGLVAETLLDGHL